jgi:hypothetical protein
MDVYDLLFFLAVLRAGDFRFAAGLPVCVFFFLAGTFAPFFRASDRPIAIACFWLVTFLPEPERKVPFLRRFMALFTMSCDFFEYFAIILFSIKVQKIHAGKGPDKVTVCLYQKIPERSGISYSVNYNWN